MDKPGLITNTGIFIRQILDTEKGLSNTKVAEKVKIHFPDQDFDTKALRQYVANIRYQRNKRRRLKEARLRATSNFSTPPGGVPEDQVGAPPPPLSGGN